MPETLTEKHNTRAYGELWETSSTNASYVHPLICMQLTKSF